MFLVDTSCNFKVMRVTPPSPLRTAMPAYDITEFLRTVYQPFVYCVPSKKPEYCIPKGGCHPQLCLGQDVDRQTDKAVTITGCSPRWTDQQAHSYMPSQTLLVGGIKTHQKGSFLSLSTGFVNLIKQ